MRSTVEAMSCVVSTRATLDGLVVSAGIFPKGEKAMSNPTFAVDPADIPAVKRWLVAQDDPNSQLRSIDIDEILIGPSVLMDLPFVLQRAGVAAGSRVLLVVDETPM